MSDLFPIDPELADKIDLSTAEVKAKYWAARDEEVEEDFTHQMHALMGKLDLRRSYHDD